MLRTLIVLTTITLTAGVAAAAGEHGGHLMVGPDQLAWGPVGSMPPGATVAVLEGDPSKAGDFTMRIRFPANYVIPVHVHPVVERVTVLEGKLYFAVGDKFDRNAAQAVGPGALAVMDAGVPMYGYTKDEPAVIQLNGRGPWGIEYVNPEDDPRR
ncbi:MAG: cupin domain-containing protein [Actinomycetota bacterium]